MPGRKRLEQRIPDAGDLLYALDAIANPDTTSYNEAIIAYPDFDPREEERSETEVWMYFIKLTPKQQKKVKAEIRRFSRITGKEFRTLAPKYCKEEGCPGHFKDSLAQVHGFPPNLNNCYLYISKASRH